MTSPQKRKGDKFENEVRAYIAARLGVDVSRNKAGRAADPGDLSWRGSPWHPDCKNVNELAWRVRYWFDEAAREAGDDLKPLLILRREGTTDTGLSLAVLRLKDLTL